MQAFRTHFIFYFLEHQKQSVFKNIFLIIIFSITLKVSLDAINKFWCKVAIWKRSLTTKRQKMEFLKYSAEIFLQLFSEFPGIPRLYYYYYYYYYYYLYVEYPGSKELWVKFIHIQIMYLGFFAPRFEALKINIFERNLVHWSWRTK